MIAGQQAVLFLLFFPMIVAVAKVADTATSSHAFRVHSSTADPLMTAEAITFYYTFYFSGLSFDIFARLLDGTLDAILEGPPASLRL